MDILFSKKKIGFSLIELLLVIMFISATMITILKNRKKKTLSPHELMQQINEVTQKVFLESLDNQRLCKFSLFFDNNQLVTDIGYSIFKDNSNESDISFSIKKKLSHPFYIHHCFINNKDEATNNSKELWFFFYGNGSSQEVSFMISKKEHDPQISYILNPLNGKIEDSPYES